MTNTKHLWKICHTYLSLQVLNMKLVPQWVQSAMFTLMYEFYERRESSIQLSKQAIQSFLCLNQDVCFLLSNCFKKGIKCSTKLILLWSGNRFLLKRLDQMILVNVLSVQCIIWHGNQAKSHLSNTQGTKTKFHKHS